MHKYNFKNFIKCNSIHVRKWICGLLATQIILLPNYSFAQINSDITVQQMNNSFGVSAFDLTNYNLALNLNFGNKNPDTTYGALTAIYRGLAQAFGPAYYYEIQNNTLNSPARYSETQNVLRSLQAVEQNQWYMNQNLISSDNNLSNINSKLTTQNSLLSTQNSLLYDYNHDGNAAFSVGSTSRNTAVNTQSINNAVRNIDWNTLVDGTFINSSGTVINSQTQVTPNNSNYYFKFDFSGKTNEFAILKLVLPLVSGGRNGNDYTLEFYEMNGSNAIIRFPDPKYVYEYDTAGTNLIVYISDYFYNFQNVLVRVIPSYQYYFFGGSANIPKSYYLTSNQQDYLDVSQYIFMRKNMNTLEDIYNKDFTAEISGDVNIDTSDIIDAINNLSLQDNDVKLNLTINNNTGSDGTSVINRLQNFFNTGTSISDFFDNVDDAESGWFTQTNSDLINTLSGGYVNLYE